MDVKKVLLDMREYRMGLIQTPDQLRFSYMAVMEGSKLILEGSSTAQVTLSTAVKCAPCVCAVRGIQCYLTWSCFTLAAALRFLRG